MSATDTTAVGRPAKGRVMLVRHTAGWMEADQYKHDLSAAGYDCELADHLHTAHAAPCDVVVLCGVSPDITRATLAVGAMEQLYPDVRIVVLTGHKEPSNIAQFATPRTRILHTPIHIRELLVAVEQEVAAKRKTAPR